MNQCHRCASVLPPGVPFCQQCGEQVARPVMQTIPSNPLQQPVQTPMPTYHPAQAPVPYQAQPMPAPYMTGALHAPGPHAASAPLPPNLNTYHGKMAGGIAQMFGLHPTIAVTTILVDLMVFGGTVMSVGMGWPVLAMAAVGLGYVTYKGQMNWFGDDADSAKIKAVIITVLTAIPVPLASALAVFMGITGRFRRGKNLPEMSPAPPQPVQMIACGQCRNANLMGAQFCQYCQAPLYGAPRPVQQARPGQPQSQSGREEFDTHAQWNGQGGR
jgi:hypothetical protein